MKTIYTCPVSIFVFIFITASYCFPQELDISSYLKKIEAGEISEVSAEIPKLKKLNPNNPSIIYLEGLLTEDGENAFQIFKSLVDKFPKSKYADAALYRAFCYLIAVDKLQLADKYFLQLKNDYPSSSYVKLSEETAIALKSKEKIDVKQLASKNKFTIQAGAFTRKENALNLKSDFNKAGYSSRVTEKIVGGSVFHVVYVGSFGTEEEALTFSKVINSKFKLQSWVTKVE